MPTSRDRFLTRRIKTFSSAGLNGEAFSHFSFLSNPSLPHSAMHYKSTVSEFSAAFPVSFCRVVGSGKNTNEATDEKSISEVLCFVFRMRKSENVSRPPFCEFPSTASIPNTKNSSDRESNVNIRSIDFFLISDGS